VLKIPAERGQCDFSATCLSPKGRALQTIVSTQRLAVPRGACSPRRSGALRAFLALPALAALAVLLSISSGCRPPRPAPVLAPATPDSLCAWLGESAAPSAFSGKATLRITIDGRRVPALNAQFVVFREQGIRMVLRPGVLGPVLSLWVGEREWDLRFPRQQVAFAWGTTAAMRASPPPDAGGPEGADRLDRTGIPSPAALTRIGWCLVAPATLVGSLREPVLTEQGGRWILRGRLSQDFGAARSAEIWIDSGSRGIALWSLEDASGRTLARVAYDPPFESGSKECRMSFLLPGLDAQGGVAVERLAPHDDPPGPRPVLPSGWELIPSQELPEFLQRLTEDAGDGP
jgi:hypothetical protein